MQSRNPGITHRIAVVAVVLTTLYGCGGGGGGSSTAPTLDLPSTPTQLAATAGSGAISLGWSEVANDGGAAVQDYEITLTPAESAAVIDIDGRRALIRGLTNGTGYTLAVRARNQVGLGAAVTSNTLTPHAADTANYLTLSINGDTSLSGVFDPSLIRTSATELWMAYSGVDYYLNGSGELVRDVGVHVAKSEDNGSTFTKAVSVAPAAPAVVTDTDSAFSACGAATCTGRWVHETSWLIDDETDPNTSERFKMFASKYFLNPGNAPDTLYHLGSIVMWTAANPAGPWSAETSILGWNLTPPETAARFTLNSLDNDLAGCIIAVEGSAAVRSDSIDFAFACPYDDGGTVLQKIVMLRSTDHLSTLTYVGTALAAADAATLGATHYSAPALLAGGDNAPHLIVTPVTDPVGYSGCVVIPLSSEDTGTVFRVAGAPAAIQGITTRNGRFGGACTAIRQDAAGILLSELIPGATVLESQFRIIQTGTSL